MELLQILAIIFALFALSRAILRMKDGNLSMGEFLFWNVVWIGVITIAFIPDVTVSIAQLFGIGRGVDLLIYTSIILLFYLIFRIYIKTEQMEQDITKLVSEYALKEKEKKMKKSLSVVIPAYNEESRILKTLIEVLSFLKENVEDFEIIIIDDGSKDNTFKIITQFKKENKDNTIIILQNKPNKGKGYTIKKGIFNAKKEFVLFADADNSTPISELSKFFKLMNTYDILIASRNLKQSQVKKQPWYRRLPGKIFPFLVKLLIIREIKDTQCGFKFFRTKQAIQIFRRQTLYGWAFDAEIMFIAKKLRYSIKEVPVRWINDPGSKLNIFKDSIKMFFELLKIRLNDLRGVYN